MSTDDTTRTGIFISEIIDIEGCDLSAVRDLPSAVLRAAIRRVYAELSDGTRTSAFFQSSLHGTLPEDQVPEISQD